MADSKRRDKVRKMKTFYLTFKMAVWTYNMKVPT